MIIEPPANYLNQISRIEISRGNSILVHYLCTGYTECKTKSIKVSTIGV